MWNIKEWNAMLYQLVARSKSGATQVYRGKNGQHIQVDHLKSGCKAVSVVPGIPECLTVHIVGGNYWDIPNGVPDAGIVFSAVHKVAA